MLTHLRYVWYAVIAFATVAVIAACLTIDYGEYLTDDVARKLHGRTVQVGTQREQSSDVAEIEKMQKPTGTVAAAAS
jgi:hypothetical protein